MRMPFGRWRDHDLTEIDEGYLEWLLTIELRDFLRAAVMDELEDRRAEARRRREQRAWEQRQRAETPKQPRGLEGAVVIDLLREGYRVLALKHHPDRGGDTAAMQAVNLAAGWLREVVGRALPAGTNGNGARR